MNLQTPQSVDGVVTLRRAGGNAGPRSTRESPQSGGTKTSRRDPRLARQPTARERAFAGQGRAKPQRKAWRDQLQMPLIIGGAVLAGLTFQDIVLGQLAVLAYGVAALIYRLPSRTSFILALLSLIATTLLLVLKGDVALSQNFAVYTFLFLVVGVITLNRELKKEGGRVYSRRTRTNI